MRESDGQSRLKRRELPSMRDWQPRPDEEEREVSSSMRDGQPILKSREMSRSGRGVPK